MYQVEIPKTINNIISLLYRLSFWHRGEKASIRDIGIKLFYSCYYLLLPISCLTGAIISDNKDDSIFVSEVGISIIVLSTKLLYLIWNEKKILELLNRIAIYSVEDVKDFILVNNKLEKFTKFIKIYLIVMFFGATFGSFIPILRGEQKLSLNIGFPLDYKNDITIFWTAPLFLYTEMLMSIIATLLSILIWYLMIACALRYEVLGKQIINMGAIKATEATRKNLNVGNQNIFRRHLIAAIEYHKNLREYYSFGYYRVTNIKTFSLWLD